jgi:hypothetical protein
MNPPAGAEFPDRVVVSAPGTDNGADEAWMQGIAVGAEDQAWGRPPETA